MVILMFAYPILPWVLCELLEFLGGAPEGAGRLEASKVIYLLPAWYWLIYPGALVVFVAALVIACYRGGWARTALPCVWAMLMVFVFAAAVIDIGFFRGYDQWAVVGEMRVDGERYVALSLAGFWGETSYWLATDDSNWAGAIVGRRYRIIGSGEGRALPLVRPARGPLGETSLWRAPDDRLVVLSEGNVCQFIYDPATEEFLPPMSWPFILLGPADDLRVEDVDAFLRYRADDPLRMNITLRHIASNHPNPHVRALAEKLPMDSVYDR